MKLQEESLANNQEVDFGPLLEENNDTPPQDIIPTNPVTVTSSDETVAAIVPYAGPVPPTDTNLLTAWNKAAALLPAGTDPTTALPPLMGTLRAVKGASGTCTITFGDPDLTADEYDMCDVIVLPPAPDKPTHLVGDTFGALRQQQ